MVLVSKELMTNSGDLGPHRCMAREGRPRGAGVFGQNDSVQERAPQEPRSKQVGTRKREVQSYGVESMDQQILQ